MRYQHSFSSAALAGFLIGAAAIGLSPARAQALPHLPVEAPCRAKMPSFWVGRCIKKEQDAYDDLQMFWSSVSPATREWCLKNSAVFGLYAYSRLDQCVEAWATHQEEMRGQQQFHY